MRPNRLRLGAIAAWLGVLALSLDALVPIHLAFDIAEALGTAAHRADATDHDPSWRLLALVIGHQDGDEAPGDRSNGHSKHHHYECPVCSALGTLAGFAPAAVVPVPIPFRIEAPVLVVSFEAALHAAPTIAYRSRAPPIASADRIT